MRGFLANNKEAGYPYIFGNVFQPLSFLLRAPEFFLFPMQILIRSSPAWFPNPDKIIQQNCHSMFLIFKCEYHGSLATEIYINPFENKSPLCAFKIFGRQINSSLHKLRLKTSPNRCDPSASWRNKRGEAPPLVLPLFCVHLGRRSK